MSLWFPFAGGGRAASGWACLSPQGRAWESLAQKLCCPSDGERRQSSVEVPAGIGIPPSYGRLVPGHRHGASDKVSCSVFAGGGLAFSL